MDITPYVEQLRHDLQNAADVGDDQARAAAGRLLLALDPSARLVLMDALSQAASEITADLSAGAVEVRLVGREIDFVVDVPTGPPAPPSPPPPPGEDVEDAVDTSPARVTLRLPETVKKRAEDLAAQGGLSLNNWLVSVVRQATSGGPTPPPASPPWPFGGSGRHQLSGWL